jgi:hypothetical protein
MTDGSCLGNSSDKEISQNRVLDVQLVAEIEMFAVNPLISLAIIL